MNTAASPRRQSPSLTVLLVDDRADDRELFEEVLRAAGYRVAVAVSGLAGYEQAVTHRPDVVIADIMMPGRSMASN